MGPVVTIADPADGRVDDYRNLTDGQRRRGRGRGREQADGTFLAEGTLVIRQLLASSYPVRSLLVTAAKLDELAPDLVAAGSVAPVYLVDAAAMEAISGFAFHRGALASAWRVPPPPAADLLGAVAARLVAVVEGVNDHENLGALFRNAAAFGVGAVLLSPNCADPLYRRSVRVSMGHVLRLPWTRLALWPAGMDELRRAGFTVVGLTPDPAAPTLDQVLGDLGPVPVGPVGPVGPMGPVGPVGSVGPVGPVGPVGLAVLVGAEGPGLSAGARRAVDALARIPMAPGVDSLNVATAAAIAFHRLNSSNCR